MLVSRCTSCSIEPLAIVSKRWRDRLTRRDPNFEPEVEGDLNARPKIKTVRRANCLRIRRIALCCAQTVPNLEALLSESFIPNPPLFRGKLVITVTMATLAAYAHTA